MDGRLDRDFASALVFTFHLIPERFADWMAVFTLEIAGTCFLFSVSKAFETAFRRWLFILFIFAPSVAYWTCLVFDVHNVWPYRVLLIVAVSAGIVGTVAYYGLKDLGFGAVHIGNIGVTGWLLTEASTHPEYGIYFLLLNLFANTGVVYWRRYRRVTPGVVFYGLVLCRLGLRFSRRRAAGQLKSQYCAR